MAVLAILCVTCAGAIAARAAGARPAPRLCSSIVPLGAIQAATHLPGTRLSPKPVRSNQWWVESENGTPVGARIPGSECTYDDPTPNTSYTQIEFGLPTALDDYVTVGYGESQRSWHMLMAGLAANGGDTLHGPTSGISGHAPESPLKLGNGSRAFLNTVNLVAAGDANPTADPQFPSQYDVVTVLTKHHDVLEVGLYNATATSVETVVRNVLNRSPTF